MAWSSLAREADELDVLREWLRLCPADSWRDCTWAMNSQDGAVCGSNGEPLSFLPSKCAGIEANCGGTEVGGMSGDDARVVPDQREETGDSIGEFRTCSHWLIAIVGMLLCENPLMFIPLVSNEVANVVSRSTEGGPVSCQLKSAVAAASIVSSIPSIPCIGAFTCAASCDSS